MGMGRLFCDFGGLVLVLVMVGSNVAVGGSALMVFYDDGSRSVVGLLEAGWHLYG